MNMIRVKLRQATAEYKSAKVYLAGANVYVDKDIRKAAMIRLNVARGKLQKLVKATCIILYGQDKPPTRNENVLTASIENMKAVQANQYQL